MSDEQYSLPDSLYAGSKDWLASDYSGRVEWLHAMYESKKRELDDLYSRIDEALLDLRVRAIVGEQLIAHLLRVHEGRDEEMSKTIAAQMVNTAALEYEPPADDGAFLPG